LNPEQERNHEMWFIRSFCGKTFELGKFCYYRCANTSIAAEARRPIKDMKRRLASARKSLTISSPRTRRTANLNGSETHARTNRNSKGACTHDVASKPITVLGPLNSATTAKVAPRLKKPSKPPVNSENPASRRLRVVSRMGGVQRTLPNIRGYKKERATGIQLLKKISNITATAPRENAARTGVMTRALMRNSRNSRKVNERTVISAPAMEPRPKATRVAPNPISMNFMANQLDSKSFDIEAG